MTARDIQRRLIVERYRRSFILHNYTPAKWFECDLFEITKAGYFREYEIKLTLSDFKADATKQKTIWQYNTNPQNGRGAFDRTPGEKKHDTLRLAAAHGPSQFWFVCPIDLIAVAAVPDWAGLIYVHEWKGHKPPWRVIEREVKRAPRLHREKVSPEVERHARGVCYYRLHNLFLHNRIEAEAENTPK